MNNPYHQLATPEGLAIRYGVWPSQTESGRGSVLLLNGRAEFMEKHGETVYDLNNRGYTVFSMDWRGQGMSGRELADRTKAYVASFDDYMDDLVLFWQEVVNGKAKAPIFLLAHSMGGHLGLRLLHDMPGRIERAVLTAPMVDIETAPVPGSVAQKIAFAGKMLGLSKRSLPFAKVFQGDRNKFEGNRLTSDPVRFMDEHRAVDENPDLGVEGVTFGWLAAAYESIEHLRGPGYPEKIDTPVLILSAGDDRVVRNSAQAELCLRLPKGRQVTIPGARHEILKEADPYRNRFWELFNDFIGGF